MILRQRKLLTILFVFLCCIPGKGLMAQDTLSSERTDSLLLLHSPQRATMLSAALPGLGQIYNKRAWKAPIVYVGFGAVVYFINFNNNQYNRFKKEYLYRVDKDPTTNGEYTNNPNVTDASIKGAMDTYRRWRDMNIFGIAGLYMLQVIDANVDAYFYRFDISKDLSMQFTPSVQLCADNTALAPGFTCLIKLK